MIKIAGELDIIKLYGIKDKGTVRVNSSLTNGLVVVVGRFGQCSHRTSHFHVNKSYVQNVECDGKVRVGNGLSAECLMALCST